MERRVSPGVEAIAAERRRQIEVEGWTHEHDDLHADGQLAEAAACYITPRMSIINPGFLLRWPWNATWWKPKSRREDFVRAGALIAAEIDRLDRIADRIKEVK